MIKNEHSTKIGVKDGPWARVLVDDDARVGRSWTLATGAVGEVDVAPLTNKKITGSILLSFL